MIGRLRALLVEQAPFDEAGARRLVEDIALVLQASVLLRSGNPMADAFCRSRLVEPHRLAFGTLASGIDTDAILLRAL